MAARSGEPKLLFPGLASFYESVSDLWYPMIRVGIGGILFMHGWGKLNAGVGRVAGAFGTNYGLPMPTFLAYSALFLETVGCICIIIGLFTRLRGGDRDRTPDRDVRGPLGQGLLG